MKKIIALATFALLYTYSSSALSAGTTYGPYVCSWCDFSNPAALIDDTTNFIKSEVNLNVSQWSVNQSVTICNQTQCVDMVYTLPYSTNAWTPSSKGIYPNTYSKGSYKNRVPILGLTLLEEISSSPGSSYTYLTWLSDYQLIAIPTILDGTVFVGDLLPYIPPSNGCTNCLPR